MTQVLYADDGSTQDLMGLCNSFHPREVEYPMIFSRYPIYVKAFPDFSHSYSPIQDENLKSQFMPSRLDPNRADSDLLPISLHSK